MKRPFCKSSLVLAGLSVALSAHSIASETQHVPPSIEGTTNIKVVVASCKGELKKQLEVRDAGQVKKLVAEMEQLRRPNGVAASKFGCDTAVTFLKDDVPVTLVHVFPCSAIERAPASLKRYFQYSGGFGQLPELSRLVKGLGKGVECK
ncbi:hypothetical protein [Piscinibacter gummiphilus]|uniref:Secreted protein n=1 Tax=Piscinibacter gummiphilus TaxID=946333 RepID=A0ABZ0CVR2_9BURK|nr:hypothetical protein [Piscinibacter gummiphilus]WOB06943.1 hypothetical protein RXV79_18695 [Piscinibacter gummiphilus]